MPEAVDVDEHRGFHRVERRVGTTGEGTQIQVFADVSAGRCEPIVDRDTGAIGDSHQSTECGDGGRSLRCGGGADGANQLDSELPEWLALHGGLREGKQNLAMSDADLSFDSTDCHIEIDLLAQRIATRTEQRGVSGRSIEALVQRRDPRRHQFDLGPRQRCVPHQLTHPGAEYIGTLVDRNRRLLVGTRLSARATLAYGNGSSMRT